MVLLLFPADALILEVGACFVFSIDEECTEVFEGQVSSGVSTRVCCHLRGDSRAVTITQPVNLGSF